ncbi:FAD-dependent oxidoreductase [Sulfitobacter sp. TSTF-M16]|uniref:FAD-dependent oxidoreductase n=1 Tax=Sulfitobacter aestuariivivens TaxID=2766981 RepID=A0A927D7A0_9RHOB|nr:FAD-dependent oxidoreductase [Sulfitobacter aestuariivivens]MBD3666229.1 FAD-dependent oxidoreductase [Sulfitobacter aestuariivivens]
MSKNIVIIGAGIVGVSTGIWLRRLGAEVTILDRGAPGQGTSYGNAGVLAACAMVPVTIPGLVAKSPKLVMNPDFPLFLRWSYLPRLAPWLVRYLANANDRDTRRIAKGLTPITSDTVEQHKALTAGTDAARWVTDCDYHFAYKDRAAFEADSYTWKLRRKAGFAPEITEGDAVKDREPNLSGVNLLATMKAHGTIRNPGGYVAHLAEVFQGMGGTLRQTEVKDFERTGGQVTAVRTKDGPVPCDQVVIATGVWSKPLMEKMGIKVPLETERGYHILFEGATNGALSPTMVAAGKFVATPMDAGLRCAGVVEFGGLDAGPSKGPLKLLRRQVKAAYPDLKYAGTEKWLGHRPAPSDSLPLIGEVGQTGVFTAFGHHHIGLTGGPKTGRLLANMIMGAPPNIDMSTYSPNRFAT